MATIENSIAQEVLANRVVPERVANLEGYMSSHPLIESCQELLINFQSNFSAEDYKTLVESAQIYRLGVFDGEKEMYINVVSFTDTFYSDKGTIYHAAMTAARAPMPKASGMIMILPKGNIQFPNYSFGTSSNNWTPTYILYEPQRFQHVVNFGLKGVNNIKKDIAKPFPLQDTTFEELQRVLDISLRQMLTTYGSKRNITSKNDTPMTDSGGEA